MKLARSVCVCLALSAVFALGSSAKADIVQFVTTGTFTGGSNTTSGTNTYTDAAHGILMTFTSPPSSPGVNVPPASQVSFGQFNTTGTTGLPTPGTLGGTFTLNIFQTAPTPGTVAFAGTLSGALTNNSSQAFVQFNAPLTQNIGLVSYSIVSADNNSPGRVNIAPPSTNLGVTTIAGSVNAVPIPEPSSLLLSALLAPALLALVARTRRSVHSSKI
jgi:hypothetical protein